MVLLRTCFGVEPAMVIITRATISCGFLRSREIKLDDNTPLQLRIILADFDSIGGVQEVCHL